MEVKIYKSKDDDKIIFSEFESGKNYIELIPNTVDAKIEKHKPIYEIIDNKICVTVGSEIHPMDNNHYIMWIAVVYEDNSVIKKDLKPGLEPKSFFEYQKNSKIYCYCNLHGLWETIVE